MGRVVSTIITVIISVAAVGGIWSLVNLGIDLAQRSWRTFTALGAATVAAIAFGITRGNQVLTALWVEEDPINFGAGGENLAGKLEWSVTMALLWGIGVFIMNSLPQRIARVAIGGALGVITGWLIADHLLIFQRPIVSWGSVIFWTILGVVIALAPSLWQRRPIVDAVPHALIGAVAGSTIAFWLRPDFGISMSDGRWASIVPLLLLGVRIGWNGTPDASALARFDNRARAAIFLGPALLFLTAALVIPSILTIIYSFRSDDLGRWVGLDQYDRFVSQASSFDVSDWDNIFTSQLFFVALILVATGLFAGMWANHRRNATMGFERTGTAVASLAGAGLLLAFAAFSVLRGTFFNNLWWVATVPIVSTALGLTIAVLSERAGRFESIAKSLIFMPMAVSFVGASIVWRLQYQPRDVTKRQTGLLNALWVELGQLSHSGWPRVLALLLLGAVIVMLIRACVLRGRESRTFAPHATGAVVVGYLFIELLRRSLGGFRFDETGELVQDTIVFTQEPPFNNVFLMVILIWIQTGFAMVILSAAIKAVPSEFLEAARVDGADESQTFFNVTLPQILPTVGVVMTTLIVLVTKVYDIVKVTTGGKFDTNVLANEMIEESFSFANRGFGSAIAVLILLSVMPVMLTNIRRMQRERLAR